MRYLILTDNEIINAEGQRLSFDEMIDKINCQETILKFSHGNFALSYIQQVQPGLRCEQIPVVKVELASGEQFSVLEDSEMLTTGNIWVKVKDLAAGQGLKALTYNPYVKHPQLTPKIVKSVENSIEPFLPSASFETKSDNLLLSVMIDEYVSTLLPLRPVEESVTTSTSLLTVGSSSSYSKK